MRRNNHANCEEMWRDVKDKARNNTVECTWKETKNKTVTLAVSHTQTDTENTTKKQQTAKKNTAHKPTTKYEMHYRARVSGVFYTENINRWRRRGGSMPMRVPLFLSFFFFSTILSKFTLLNVLLLSLSSGSGRKTNCIFLARTFTHFHSFSSHNFKLFLLV